jgi:hypothetical protein
MKFTSDELKAISTLLSRVDIKGSEAMTIVVLQQKIAKIIKDEQAEKPEEKK